MNTIKFSSNWNNKLDSKVFTSFRLHNPNRYKKGDIFLVEINGKPHCRAKVLEVKSMKLNQISEFEARIDTGYQRNKFINLIKKMYTSKALMYDSQLFDLILFERLDSQLTMH